MNFGKIFEIIMISNTHINRRECSSAAWPFCHNTSSNFTSCHCCLLTAFDSLSLTLSEARKSRLDRGVNRGPRRRLLCPGVGSERRSRVIHGNRALMTNQSGSRAQANRFGSRQILRARGDGFRTRACQGGSSRTQARQRGNALNVACLV